MLRRSQSTVEEFSTSNFVGMNQQGDENIRDAKVSLRLAIHYQQALRPTVEARDIPVAEPETFDEVLAVGTELLW